ncbi:hypothetical protein [Methylosinus sp. KRF6]|uniref:hypothetical protein n=1 Tax=Methylosinus sp. KRF6 TaxID=2846853 RepID=UPI001C0BA677|nr:hypothetical protein [Methylosinus sp. KRF6]MBU3887633.1 hypothetical protein [Methylosinus sp. KRF6]
MECAAHASAHGRTGDRAAERLVHHVVHERLVGIGLLDSLVLRELLQGALRQFLGEAFARCALREISRERLRAAALADIFEECLRDHAIAHAAEQPGREPAGDEGARSEVTGQGLTRRIVGHARLLERIEGVRLLQSLERELLDFVAHFARTLRAAERAFRDRAGDCCDGSGLRRSLCERDASCNARSDHAFSETQRRQGRCDCFRQ